MIQSVNNNGNNNFLDLGQNLGRGLNRRQDLLKKSVQANMRGEEMLTVLIVFATPIAANVLSSSISVSDSSISMLSVALSNSS